MHLHVVDLSSLQQIQRFSHDFAHSGCKLHVLINNAATMQDTRGETVEGVEMAQVEDDGWFNQPNIQSIKNPCANLFTDM